jgi:PPM family protein phosphatase
LALRVDCEGAETETTKADPVRPHAWWSKLLTWWSKLWGTRGGGPAERKLAAESTAEFPSTPPVSLESGGLRLRVGVVSTTGNVREHNEDNFYVPGRPSLRNTPSAEFRLNGGGAVTPPPAPTTIDYPHGSNGPAYPFIVADGMGGQLAGEKASQMAVELIPRELARRIESDADEKSAQRAVRDAVAAANQEILALSHLETDYASMGTTVVLALFHNDRAYVAGIGDSRAYRLRDSKFDQLTRDHSLANALGEAGTIRPDEVENHKFKHVLYLYLGSKDARDGPEEVKALDVRPGDQFLLASDGLTGVVRDEEIVDVLGTCNDPQRAAQALVNRALENRSKDNITCVVIHVVGASGTVS